MYKKFKDNDTRGVYSLVGNIFKESLAYSMRHDREEGYKLNKVVNKYLKENESRCCQILDFEFNKMVNNDLIKRLGIGLSIVSDVITTSCLQDIEFSKCHQSGTQPN